MKTIKIVVRDKIAVTMDETQYICGNSDFVVNFDFDAEWDGFDVKTVRFIKDNRKYIDVVLRGNECPVPVIFNTNKIMVGVFAGNLRTTTEAIIPAQKGILCRDGSPEAPSDDVYAQIMEQMQGILKVDHPPAYVLEEADRIASELLLLRSANTFTFAVVSDCHANYGGIYAENSQTSIKHAAMAMERIGAQVGLDFVVNLGDNLWGTNTDLVAAKQEALILNRLIYDAFHGQDQFRLVGNHDANLATAVIPTAEVFAMNGNYNTFEVIGETRMRGYGYSDYDQLKVRVIGLNTSDYLNLKGGFAMSDEQKLWFMQALDLSDKEDAANWQTLILSHFPLDFPSGDYNTPADVSAILKAYVSGNSVSISAGTYDYNGKNTAQIIANIHGHIHNFSYGFMSGSNILRVCTPNTSFYNSGAAGTGHDSMYQPNETYDKVVGTAQDTTMTVYTIDLFQKKIFSTNYGAGYDREIAYQPPEAFEQVVEDLAVAVRQNLYITNGTLDPASGNTRMILACSTPNGHGWATRESTTVYLIPVPKEASSVTVETSDAKEMLMDIILINVSDGTYSRDLNSGLIPLGTFAFEAGAYRFMAINLGYTDDSSIPWGYDVNANIKVTFKRGNH